MNYENKNFEIKLEIPYLLINTDVQEFLILTIVNSHSFHRFIHVI
ncbi:MAG: hypothetical protein Ta2E_10240 [Mycoplasmoidaceae bacterium]|nr:MAG: hypothetical protein Ta2E_10240 [Mycoplasmoidaceae bacterium]